MVLPVKTARVKNKYDPRHLKRIKNLQALFANSFGNNSPSTDTSKNISQNNKKIDKLIHKFAPKWPIDQINRVDLAILRLAIWELQAKDTPPKVIIDEAVELAKQFGTETSSSFVNGVLASTIKGLKIQI